MKTRCFCLAAFSGILTTLAIPNEIKETGYSILGFVAYVPLFIALNKLEDKKALMGLTVFYFIIANSLQNFWLGFFHAFGWITFIGVIIGYIPYSLTLGYFLYYSLKSFKNKTMSITMLFTFYDYSRSIGFLAYPWGLAAFTVNNFNNLIQVADIFGVFFVSFAVYFLNSGIADFLIHKNKTNLLNIAFPTLLITASFTYGMIKKIELKNLLAKEIDSLNIAAIQLNTDPWLPGNDKKGIRDSIEITEQALKENSKIEFVIWSEGVLTYPFSKEDQHFKSSDLHNELKNFIKEHKIPFAIGAPSNLDKAMGIQQNSIYMIEPNLNITNIYSKIFLVPFAEKIPFYEYKFVRNFFLKNFRILGQIEGNKIEILKLKKFKFAPLICYDDAFPELSRFYKTQGANILVNFSNDSWSKTNSAEWQHFVVAKFRSIENGIKTIRATNSGITATINEYGETIKKLETFKKGYLLSTVKLSPTFTTIYEKIGDLFIHILAMMFLITTLRFQFMEDKNQLLSSSVVKIKV